MRLRLRIRIMYPRRSVREIEGGERARREAEDWGKKEWGAWSA